MIIKQTELDFGKKKTKRIGVTSCWHVGNPMCRIDRIEAMLARWKKQKTPWVNLGDTVEAVTPLDPRFHHESHQQTISMQLTEAAWLQQKAKDQLLGAVIGNHEDKLSKYYGDVTQDMLIRTYQDKTAAEEHWFGATAFVDFKCPEGSLRAFYAHSKISLGGGTSDPDRDRINWQVKLRRRLSSFQADIKFVGHGHRTLVAPPVTRDCLSPDNGLPKMSKVPVAPEWCAMCPSMFASYDSTAYPSYAEMALLPPQDIGYLEAIINRKGEVEDIDVL